MYLIQILLLSSKYVIKGNVIKHIKIKSHLAVFLSIVAFTTYIISSKVLCYNYFEDGDSETTTLDALNFIINLYFCFNLIYLYFKYYI